MYISEGDREVLTYSRGESEVSGEDGVVSLMWRTVYSGHSLFTANKSSVQFLRSSVHILSNVIGLYTTAMTSVILKGGACNVGAPDLLNNDL